MSKRSENCALTKPAAGVAKLPDVPRVRNLVLHPWTCVEVQSGALRNKSARFAGAWSASAILVRSTRDVFVYCDSVENDGDEDFTLRFADAENAVAEIHQRSARPPFSPLQLWPSDVILPADFFVRGPRSAEIGFGSSVTLADASSAVSILPVRWCCFYGQSVSLMVYADNEIPLNVGIVADQRSISAIKHGLKASFTHHLQ